MCAAVQALDGDPLELHAVDEVDALMELGQDRSHALVVEREQRLRNNEFFRDCLATGTVTLKVRDWFTFCPIPPRAPQRSFTHGIELWLWVALL